MDLQQIFFDQFINCGQCFDVSVTGNQIYFEEETIELENLKTSYYLDFVLNNGNITEIKLVADYHNYVDGITADIEIEFDLTDDQQKQVINKINLHS